MQAENTENTFAQKRLRTAYISTIISVTLVLFMLGILSFVLLESKKFSNQVKENIQLTVFLNDSTTSEDIEQVKNRLQETGYFKQVSFVSREQAAAQLKADLGEDFISFLGYNPLLPSFDLQLNAQYASQQQFDLIVAVLSKMENVEDVQYLKNIVSMVESNLRTIAIVLIAICTMLLLISIALINNTIRLALYAKRFLIKSMQLVGATRGFIRKPFIYTCLKQGLLSACLAIMMLVIVLYTANTKIPELFTLADDLKLLIYIAPAILLFGLIISLISTFFAVNKYLKVKIEELYF